MKRLLLLVFLAILWTIPAWSQLSTPVSKESTTCFSDSELAAFEAAMQAEIERTVKEAVEAAIAPHVAYEARLQADIARLTRETVWLKVGIGVSLASALGLGLYAVLK
jgi:hypothetical protein